MIYAALFTSLLCSQPEPPLGVSKVRDSLPTHDLRKCGSEELMCFQFEPFKELLRSEFDRLSLTEERPLMLQQLVSLNQKAAALNALLDVERKKSDQWKSEAERLGKKWEEENKLRHEAEIKANSPWPIVTIVVGALVGLTGAVWGAVDADNAGPWVLVGTGAVTATIGGLDLVF